MTGDIKNFYLGKLIKKYVYTKLHRSAIPQKFIDAYKLEEIFDKNDFMYIEIRRGI